MNLDLINIVETLLEESQRIRVKGFIVWIEFQDLTFYDAHIVIRLDIKLMNVHLLKIIWRKEFMSVPRIWI
jgi:hypothetical protein